MKTNLTRASDELFKRPPDECFHTLDALAAHCERTRDTAAELWPLPSAVRPVDDAGALKLDVGSVAPLGLSDWSFSQLCGMCGVAKPTINRLTPKTAGAALMETLPPGDKPIQLLTTAGRDPLSAERTVRAVHGTAYTRLWNAELLDVVREFDDFRPPGGDRHESEEADDDLSTGLYCGEQDMFAFLIDPEGWVELDTRDETTGWSRTERFAPPINEPASSGTARSAAGRSACRPSGTSTSAGTTSCGTRWRWPSSAASTPPTCGTGWARSASGSTPWSPAGTSGGTLSRPR